MVHRGSELKTLEVFGIEHIDLTVNDLQGSDEFYDKVLSALGFRRLEEDDAGEHDLRWANAHLTIAIRPAASSAQFNRHRVGLQHLAFKLKSRADVDELHRFLTRESMTILDPPAEYPQYGVAYYAVFFADPDGMKLEAVHFPWGYWKRVQTEGADPRPRH